MALKYICDFFLYIYAYHIVQICVYLCICIHRYIYLEQVQGCVYFNIILVCFLVNCIEHFKSRSIKTNIRIYIQCTTCLLGCCSNKKNSELAVT